MEYNSISILTQYSLFDRIVSIAYLPNKEQGIEFYFYSLFDRVDSIPYLIRIRNKEWSNVCVPHSVFYKNDVTLKVAQAGYIYGNRGLIYSYILKFDHATFGYLKRVTVTPILSL